MKFLPKLDANSFINPKFFSCLVILLIFTACRPVTAPIPSSLFYGCYHLDEKNEISLDRRKNIFLNRKSIGKYTINEPVPGKHGYLLNVDVRVDSIENGVISINNKNGSYWDINTESILIYSKEGSLLVFRKDACN